MNIENTSTGIKDDLQHEQEYDYHQDLKLDYILKSTQKKMNTDEKCSLIFDRIQNGRILIFEGGLDPADETKLIEKSMLSIDHEKFFGLEIFSPVPKKVSSIFKGNTRVTIITPANCEISCKTL